MYDGIIQFGPFKGMKISDKIGEILTLLNDIRYIRKEIINFIFSKNVKNLRILSILVLLMGFTLVVSCLVKE